MGTKSIRHIVETAVSTYLTGKAEFSGMQISTGDSADVQSLPRII